MAYSMEFWGIEVKAGEPLKVTPPEDTMIHVSQAALGESKKDKGKEAVPLFVKCGDQKLVIATLSSENFPQVAFDLVFEKEFELSHNWKGGSVYFCGYQVPIPDEGDEYPDSDFSEEEEEEIPLTKTENGKAAPKGDNAVAKSQAAKPESSAKQVKVTEQSKPVGGDSDEDSEDDSDADSEDDSDEDDESEGDLMSEDDDDSDEEETPKKDEVVKKRPNDSALKTPASKKAKPATPEKTDGKKGGHTATPHPSKQAGKKTPANGANPKGQTPKSGGQFSCDSCGKSFGKEVGLQSHKKAKHGDN